MLIGTKKKQKKEQALGRGSASGAARPSRNKAKKNLLVLLILVFTAVLILWVGIMGKKAEDTVTVVMLAQSIYKNQVITESMLMPYDMLKGEFEKYSVVDANGNKRRRLFLWDERGMLVNTFAAYPLKAETYAERRDFIQSRVDNSDNIMYSFPGKDTVPFSINSDELQAFKTFIQPGDRLNIEAIYAEVETVVEDDGMGGEQRAKVEVYRTETVFEDIMIADLLNGRGESILDIYSNYDELTVWQQAQLDSSEEFRTQTTPKTLLVALTPEEKERYYYFLSKSSIQFKTSMPQRIDGGSAS